jgi:C4-type Zn-finger protein
MALFQLFTVRVHDVTLSERASERVFIHFFSFRMAREHFKCNECSMTHNDNDYDEVNESERYEMRIKSEWG